MSLVPLLFSDWWEDLDRPHSLFDQHFGLSLNSDDIIAPSQSELVVYKPNKLRQRASRYHPFLHNLMKRSGHGARGTSTVSADKDKFCVTLDVQQFHPNEINVKVVGNHVIVDAKHEEKEDEHGWITRQFTRKYLVPQQCDIDRVESHLSSDGVLTISAPKKLSKPDSNERAIKIHLTGEPAISLKETPSTSEENTQAGDQGGHPGRGKKSTVKAA